MRVLLIRPKYGYYAAASPYPPLGPLALASFLQSRGHTVRIFDHAIQRDMAKVAAEFKPDAAAVTLLTAAMIPDAMQLSRRLKALGLPVFWGGPMASAIPEEVARSGCADYVGISEGEYTLLELLEVAAGKRGPESVLGIAYVDENGEYRQTAQRPFADLADFPPLDYSLIPMKRFIFPGIFSGREFMMTTSKGCPFNCTFCFNSGFHRCQRRTYPEDVLLRQIKTLANDYGVTGLTFHDEVFGMDKQELRTFCRNLNGLGLNLTWSALATIGLLSRGDLQVMYDAGCRVLYFGLESGSAEMRKKIQKYYDASKTDETFRNCREIGIQFRALFIIGLPGETPEQLRETVRLYFRLQQNMVNASYFTPIPGSLLYRELVASGRLVPAEKLERMEGHAMGFQHLAQNFSNVPDKELLVVMNYFNWQMVFGKKQKGPGRTNFITTIFFQLNNLRNSLRAGGLSGFARMVWELGKLLCMAVWYAWGYPSIRKKYDLYSRNFGRTNWDNEGSII